MSFWNQLHLHGEAPALVYCDDIGAAGLISYEQLANASDAFARGLPFLSRKRLGLLLCRNTVPAIVAYIGALRAGDAIILISEQTDHSLITNIIEIYRPDWIYRSATTNSFDNYSSASTLNGMELLIRVELVCNDLLNSELCILLSTSGTTGSPKMVRLSDKNIHTNALAISEYMGIDSNFRAVTSLPFNYSFGMSVLNSQLASGASLFVTEHPLIAREFWSGFSMHQVNLLPGVPSTFQVLQRLNPQKLPLGSLRTLIQAGGSLGVTLTEYFNNLANEKNWKFFVMYGQTEASPRISYLPPNMLAKKYGSIGIAIPGGKLSLSYDGELIYEGPNVMLGYAENRGDLARGDDLLGCLATGDLARCDKDGFFYIEGRRKRIIKINGNRISLDHLEQHLEAVSECPIAILGSDDKLLVFYSKKCSPLSFHNVLTGIYRLNPINYELHAVESMPYSPSGKKDYKRLKP